MKKISNSLFIIPARGGSKGIPGKNIKLLNGKPLINYTIEEAMKLTSIDNICVSSDDALIIDVVSKIGLNIPFVRPSDLATDISGTYEVLIHAYQFYKTLGKEYDVIILLQPTSPFRTAKHITEAFQLYTPEIDMVVSVCESDANPYYNLFEENENGFLKKVKEGNYIRRQDCPKAYLYNGAIYIINIASLIKQPLNKFDKILKYEMDKVSSTDLDSFLNWNWAEFLIEKNLV